MTVRFDGRSAVVTGAGAGLGRAHARLLASRGAKVVVNDPGRNAEGAYNADAVVAEIQAAGGEAVASYASVADAKQAQSIIDLACERFGKIDILVNNAGILRDKSFSKMSLEDFEAVLQVHLLGTVYCTKAAWDLMVQQNYGRIVLTSSASGLSGNFGQANYGAAKTGMLGLMNCLNIEGARRGVRINSIAPVAATNMTAGLLPADLEKYLGPDMVSPLVAYLCSEACEASGETFAVGGGHFARLQLFKADGLQLDPAAEITPEMIESQFAQVSDMSAAQVFKSVGSALRERLVRIGRLKAE